MNCGYFLERIELERKPATIADVARAAGVSKMTVSNVLSQDAERRSHASEQTRERVLATVQEMRYRPNARAVSLRRRATNIIGFYAGYGYVIPENAFLISILAGLQEGCDQHQKDLLLHGLFRGVSVSDIYAQLSDGRIDGLVIYSPSQDPLAKLLAASHLPVVAVADRVQDIASVSVDDVHGARITADYLFARGHRSTVYLYPGGFVESALRRKDAFLGRCRELGMSARSECVHGVPQGSALVEGEVDWLLDGGHGITSAVCWNDPVASALVTLCRKRNISVPGDLAIVGFDGLMAQNLSGMRLTTVRAPWTEVAKCAVGILVGQLHGSAPPRDTALPVELVAGETA